MNQLIYGDKIICLETCSLTGREENKSAFFMNYDKGCSIYQYIAKLLVSTHMCLFDLVLSKNFSQKSTDGMGIRKQVL